MKVRKCDSLSLTPTWQVNHHDNHHLNWGKERALFHHTPATSCGPQPGTDLDEDETLTHIYKWWDCFIIKSQVGLELASLIRLTKGSHIHTSHYHCVMGSTHLSQVKKNPLCPSMRETWFIGFITIANQTLPSCSHKTRQCKRSWCPKVIIIIIILHNYTQIHSLNITSHHNCIHMLIGNMPSPSHHPHLHSHYQYWTVC